MRSTFISVCAALFLIAAAVYAQEQPSFLKAYWGGKAAGYFTKQDASILSGGCGSDPYQELRKYGCDGGTNKTCSPVVGKGGINPQFACRLLKYFKALEQQGCQPKIINAYRSVKEQANVCTQICGDPNGCKGKGGGCGRPGSSCHQYGIAADVANATVGGSGHCRAGTPEFAAKFGIKIGYNTNGSDARSSGHIQCIERQAAFCKPGDENACGGSSGDFSAFLNNDPGPEGNPYRMPPQSELDKITAANKQAEAQAAGQQGGGSGGAQQGGGLGGGGAANGPGAQGVGQTPGTTIDGQPVDGMVLPMQNTQASCSPEQVHLGEAATIRWECPSGATPRITTQRGTRLVLPVGAGAAGSITTLPPATTHYTISCVRNTQIIAQNACDVAVLPKEASTAVLTLTTSEEEVRRGETVDITWSAKNVVAGSCTLTGPNGFEASGSKGVAESDPLTDTENTFTLSCTSLAKKTVEESVTVRVVRNPTRSTTGSTRPAVDRNTDF